MKRARKQSHHRYTGASRHSLRDGFTAYSTLFPAIGLFCHRRWSQCASIVDLLDVGVETSEPRGFVVRLACIRPLQRKRPSHPAPNTRDDSRSAPLGKARDARKPARDLPVVTSETACDILARRANQVAVVEILSSEE